MTQTIRRVGLFSVAVAFIFTLTLFRLPALTDKLKTRHKEYPENHEPALTEKILGQILSESSPGDSHRR